MEGGVTDGLESELGLWRGDVEWDLRFGCEA